MKKKAIVFGLMAIISIASYAELPADKTVINQTNQAVDIYWGPMNLNAIHIQDTQSEKVPATEVLVRLEGAYQSWMGHITHDCTLKMESSNPANPTEVTRVSCDEISLKCDPKYSSSCPASGI